MTPGHTSPTVVDLKGQVRSTEYPTLDLALSYAGDLCESVPDGYSGGIGRFFILEGDPGMYAASFIHDPNADPAELLATQQKLADSFGRVEMLS